MKSKSVAFFNFSGCTGCTSQLDDFGSDIIGLLGLPEVVNLESVDFGKFRTKKYDIAIVEGNALNMRRLADLRRIRRMSKVVIAYGSCETSHSCAMQDGDCRVIVESDASGSSVNGFGHAMASTPFHRALAADYVLDGCPVDPMQLLQVIGMALRLPDKRNVPVMAGREMSLYEFHVGNRLSPMEKCIVSLIRQYGIPAGSITGEPGVFSRYVETT